MVPLSEAVIRNRILVANAMRGCAAAFGLTPAEGNESVSGSARELFAIQAEEYAQPEAEIDKLAMAWHR